MNFCNLSKTQAKEEPCQWKGQNTKNLIKRCFHYLVPAVVKDYDFSAALWWSGLKYDHTWKILNEKNTQTLYHPLWYLAN